MNRRKLMLAAGAGALAPPLTLTPRTSLAQQPRKLRRIGILVEQGSTYAVYPPRVAAFKAGLLALGYTEGTDYVLESRYADGELGRLPALAAELVALKVDLILTSGTPSVMAASKATRVTPILTTVAGDPVGNGLVASYARPGGNITGFTVLSAELNGKRLDFLRQFVPGLRRAALLYDPNDPNDALALTQFEADCVTAKMLPMRAPVRNAGEIAAAFKTLANNKAQAVVVTNTTTLNSSRASVIELAAKYRLPASHGQSNFVEAGGLFSYAPNFANSWRSAAGYADKIFKGANPGELPLQRPTTFDLVVNMKTAKALGIKVPQSILILATRVIE